VAEGHRQEKKQGPRIGREEGERRKEKGAGGREPEGRMGIVLLLLLVLVLVCFEAMGAEGWENEEE